MEPMNNSPKLPRFIFLFFQWYCKSERLEELHGDLEELYLDRLEEIGKTRALLHYAWDVIRCCQPYAWKKIGNQLNSNTLDMFRNYLRIAVRHLLRQPGYASLNILGLTLGIVSSLVIMLYLNQELSFDNYHKDADLVYRISTRFEETDGTKDNWAVTQRPLGQELKETFAEVSQYVRFMRQRQARLQKNNVSYLLDNMYLVDSTVFDMFTFELIQGDPTTALNQPNSICLSESVAQRIFKGENPIGKLLESDNHSFQVTGVYKDQPKNSHIIADAMGSTSTDPNQHNSQSWGGWGIYTYVKLNTTADVGAVEDRLNTQIVDQYIEPIFGDDLKVVYEMLPIRDIHLHSDFEGEPVPLGSMNYIYVFAVVALFLIIIACINYMNLATARSMRRALEVGVRKTMGAKRNSLISQFMAESVVIAFVSLILSLAILIVTVPIINSILGTSLELSQLLDLKIIMGIILILILTGILSGSYPAFYLSAFTPSKALRGAGASARSGNPGLRRTLVGLQFAISIFMLISTFIIYDQMQYLRSKDLGFDKEQVATFQLRGQAFQSWNVLKSSLLQNPNISTASSTSSVPGGGYPNRMLDIENNEGVMQELGLNMLSIDFEYFPTLGIDIVQGRNFSNQFSTDTSHAVIVNEAMVHRLGWSDPIGKRIQYSRDSTVFHRVIGVAKNFHQSSLHDPIEPLLFVPDLSNHRAMLRVNGDYQETVAFVEKTWEELFPNLPLELQFLDQNFVRFYVQDQMRGNLFLGFSIMMIVIAALGLLGLASFTAEQRSKEISIRKVLGASVQGLISLMVKEFVYLVLIGAIPAFVCAYLFAKNWLAEFEYHVTINFVLFALVTLIILIITVSTTGIHALRAAQANPSKNLKNE